MENQAIETYQIEFTSSVFISVPKYNLITGMPISEYEAIELATEKINSQDVISKNWRFKGIQ